MILWDEWRGSIDGRPALYIKRLVRFFGFRIDLHKFVRADDRDCFHTHPAWAVRVILAGCYMEQFENGDFKFWWPLDIGIVRPSMSHRIHKLLNGEASYSLWFRGPVCSPVELRGTGWPKDAKPG